MKNTILTMAMVLIALCAESQSHKILHRKKGSYLYYGQPHIEDNSMLIDEAFNQSHRSIQHITNFSFDKNAATYWYAQEIPLKNENHQLSFSLNYAAIRKHTSTGYNFSESGLGDATLSYRPLMFGKNSRLQMVPRFTLIIPMGNAQKGIGSGGWGGEFGLAITKRIIPNIITNYNIGYTLICKADYYSAVHDGSPSLRSEKNSASKNFGASAIWLIMPRFNLMLEYLITFDKKYSASTWHNSNNSIINPGFRFALHVGKMQIVPSVGMPLNFIGNRFSSTGLLLYVSIEHDY